MSDRARQRPHPPHPPAAESAQSRAHRAAIWSALTLIPAPIPDLSLDEISTETRVFGYDCGLPVILRLPDSAAPAPDRLRALALAASGARVPFSVGPLEPELDDPEALSQRRMLAELAPGMLAFRELRASSLKQPGITVNVLREVLIATAAGGIIIWLDFPERAIRGGEGVDATGTLDALRQLAEMIEIPVLVRSMAGLPRWTARALVDAGIEGLLVGGAEVFSASNPDGPGGDRQEPEAPELPDAHFNDWGIPTVAAVRMLRSIGVPVISGGQVESGLDAAKAIALGADLVVPGPTPATEREDQLIAWLDTFAGQLRTTMFLTGCRRLSRLKQAPFVATGQTREWLEAAEMSWRGDG